MRVLIWLAIAAGLVAGGRWVTARGVWTDHQAVRARERELRKLRWVSWRKAAVGVAFVGLMLWVSVAARPGE